MAESKTEQPASEAPTKGTSKLSSMVVLAVIGVLSGGAGFATPYVALRLQKKDAAAGHAEAHAPADHAEAEGEMAFIAFGEVIVNLYDGRMVRYLRLNMTLRVDKKQEETVNKAVEERKVILKDWLLRYLSDQDMEDIRGSAGKNRLRREILDQFNTMLFSDGYDRIHDVLFEEFNVQ